MVCLASLQHACISQIPTFFMPPARNPLHSNVTATCIAVFMDSISPSLFGAGENWLDELFVCPWRQGRTNWVTQPAVERACVRSEIALTGDKGTK